MSSELRLYRRHLAQCSFESRNQKGCACPIWCDGYDKGRRIRHSMQTSNWERAERKLDRMIDPGATPRSIKIPDAISDYLDDGRARGLKASTLTSYRKTLGHFEAFCSHEAYPTLTSLTLEAFTQFRASRKGRQNRPARVSTLRKETECLRAFCAFALDRRWMPENLAKKLRPAREPSPAALPFEESELEALFSACNKFGNRESTAIEWARRRARTFMLLLLYSGLRISDAAAVSRAQLNTETGHLYLRRQMKTGTPLQVKLPNDLVGELAGLGDSKYFFWNGTSKLSTIVGLLRRAIARICRIAKINGHPHRFRDTFAKRLLDEDVPLRTVQLLLGHTSIRTTERHYAQFVQSQQRLLDQAVDKLPSLRKLPELALKNSVGNTQRGMRTAAH